MPEIHDAPTLEIPKISEFEEGLNKIQIVDVSDAVAANAIDRANEYINEKTRQNGIGGFLKKIWYGNLARDIIRQKEINKGRKAIIESGNIYATDADATRSDHDQAVAAVVDRFTEDFGLHEGEDNKKFEDAKNGVVLLGKLKELVGGYATGVLDYNSLVEEKTRLLNEYGKHVQKSDRNRGLVYADNIVEVAQNAKLAAEHGLALERIDAALGGKIGEARMGVRTEAHLQLVDRAVDKTHKITGGLLINEGTLGIAYATAMTIAKVTTTKFAVAAAATALPGIAGGAIAGVREHLRVGQERQLHIRQMAEGAAMPATEARRREKMEATRYQTASAHDLIDSLSNVDGLLASETGPDLNAAMLAICETQARISMSDGQSKDLISYSKKTSVEQERLDLDISLAQAKVKLNKYVEGLSDEQRAAIGLETDSLNNIIDQNTAVISGIISGDISEKDKAFRKLRAARTLKMAAVGAVMGVSLGLALQETHSLLDNGLLGSAENPSGGGENRQSLLSAALGLGATHQTDESTNLVHREWVGGPNADLMGRSHTGVDLPPGYHFYENGKGRWNLVNPDGKVSAEDLYFDKQGNLSHDSRTLLTSKRFNLSQHVLTYNKPHTVSETTTRTIQEYLKAHPQSRSDLTQVHRELWYDNNTPGVYDKNELKLWWGGQNGLDDKGNYIFNVGHMSPDGSFHAGLSTDAQSLVREGKMAIALSFTKDTQHFVQMIPIDAHGNAIIDHRSLAGQALFTTKDGHAKFIGAYAEAVQLMGKAPDGGQNMRMLATVVGENRAGKITDTVYHTAYSIHERYVTGIEAPKNLPLPIEIPPVLPLYSRKGLEALGKNAYLNNPESFGLYYGGRSMQEMREWINTDPTKIKTRREIVGPDGKKVWVEADGTPVKRDVSREREAAGSYLEKEKAAKPQHMALVEKIVENMTPMDSECRTAVNVPAWMEAKNLHNFLDQYTKQVDNAGNPLDIKTFEINILVNRKTGSEADDSVAVIEKFISDFNKKHGYMPKINYYDIELDPPLNNVGYARKLLTDAVLLRSLNRTEQTGPLYIETEDADIVSIDPRTVSNLVSKLDNYPHLDAVRGKADRDPSVLMNNDYLFLRRRIWDFAEILVRQKEFRDPRAPNWNYMWNRNWMNGWNSGYSAEAYALIGGYDPVPVGEDMILGERMTMIRGDGQLPNLEVVGRISTRSNGSPRRFIKEIASGSDAYSEDFTNEGVNKEIRDRSTEEMMEDIAQYSRINTDNQTAFNDLISSYYQFVQTSTPSNQDAQQLMKRLLFFLGFKSGDYQILGPEIQVENWKNVETALQNYRVRHDNQAVREALELIPGVRPINNLARSTRRRYNTTRFHQRAETLRDEREERARAAT